MVRIVLILQMLALVASAQNNTAKNYYSLPLSIPLSLAGNFCEIRANHFHSGIDLRTYSKEGFPVFAAADGFVSRIKISSVGYGKALYITHPNGTVTVYGHLRQFADSIQQFVQESQQAMQKFEVELFPDSAQFNVHKGEQIAISGSTGGAEGPHLHFEIRDRYTEEPLNPLLFGIQIPDATFPVITHVAVYENKSGEYKRLMLLKAHAFNDSVYAVDDTVRVPWNISTISFAFAAYDKALASDTNDVNIYAATLMNDADTIFNYSYNRMNFDDTKYANAHIDYEAKIKNKINLERCFKLPGDLFPAFKNSGNGMINLSNKTISNPKLIVKDFAGHASTLLLEIAKNEFIATIINSNQFEKLSFDTVNILKNKNASLIIPKGNLYKDVYITDIPNFNFQIISGRETIIETPGVYEPNKELNEPDVKNFYSPIIVALDKTIPLHKNAELNILADHLPALLKSKALIASVNDQNKITGSSGGVYKNGWVTTKISSFGNYVITVDTLPPVINQMQIMVDSICMCPLLSVKITDDLSGIESYIGCIDSDWALMEYDLKTDRLNYFIKPQLMGPHQLTIQASDKKGNWVYFEGCF